ncbi:MAG TPA: hypothetical protein VHN37_00085 [Actinomycetota bacterium]|nr:hypothetical protein [Actinomycetota bacterium]
MKRAFAVSLMVAVVATSLLGPAEAAKKKKKPKTPKPPALVQVDQAMYLRGDGCDAAARALSVTDAADVDNCAHLEGGAVNEYVPDGTMGPLDQPAQEEWPAIDGVPLTLDATKHVTGEIYTQGVFPLVDSSYPGLAAGNVKLTLRLVGETGGEEKTIGEFTEEWLAKPGDTYHTTVVDLVPDAAFNGQQFTSLKLITKIGGNSVGQTFYKLSTPSSFIKVPVLAPAS